MTQAGRTAWDDNAWRTAISTALGGYRHNGVLYGGFASFKGNPVSLPPGWTSDGLFRRLARASGKDWSKATVSSAPVWPDGSAVYSGQLRSLAPARLGGPRYGRWEERRVGKGGIMTWKSVGVLEAAKKKKQN